MPLAAAVSPTPQKPGEASTTIGQRAPAPHEGRAAPGLAGTNSPDRGAATPASTGPLIDGEAEALASWGSGVATTRTAQTQLLSAQCRHLRVVPPPTQAPTTKVAPRLGDQATAGSSGAVIALRPTYGRSPLLGPLLQHQRPLLCSTLDRHPAARSSISHSGSPRRLGRQYGSSMAGLRQPLQQLLRPA